MTWDRLRIAGASYPWGWSLSTQTRVVGTRPPRRVRSSSFLIGLQEFRDIKFCTPSACWALPVNSTMRRLLSFLKAA